MLLQGTQVGGGGGRKYSVVIDEVLQIPLTYVAHQLVQVQDEEVVNYGSCIPFEGRSDRLRYVHALLISCPNVVTCIMSVSRCAWVYSTELMESLRFCS